ncbi:MAG: VanZ family protein [Eubacterium sp.]|nr:VanZ family protein [Eubacterium sp.]
MKKSEHGNSDRRKKICLVLAACWMSVIFAFSARNADLSTQDSMSIGILFGRLVVPSFAGMDSDMQVSFADMVDHPIRKMAHATEYAVLGFLLVGSYADRRKKWGRMIGIPILAGSLYAVSDELHQLFVPGRSCELTDMLIDSSGVVIGTFAGLFLFVYWAGRKQRRRK